MRAPAENEPLTKWLIQALVENQQLLTRDLVHASLGPQARHAFEFDGVELLLGFLRMRSRRSPHARQFVIDGVTELVGNLTRAASERQHGGADRLETLQQAELRDSELRLPTTLDDAVDGAKRFFLLARASLERARFGGPARAADIACFETFRLAAIAADAGTHATSGELEMLAQVTSWHQAPSPQARAELPAAMMRGVNLLSTDIASFAHHSLVLRITARNSTVAQRLQGCAIDLLTTTLRLDGVSADEEAALTATVDQDSTPHADSQLTEDLAMIADSLFIIPRGRGGRLAPDPEFDQLWALYRDAVPWTTADRSNS